MPDNEKELERAEPHRTNTNKLTCPPATEQRSEIAEDPFLYNGSTVSKKDFLIIKEKIHNKSGGFCKYCRKKLKLEEMVIIRKVPILRKGSNRIKNLIPVCLTCIESKRPMNYWEIRRKRIKLRKKHSKNIKDITVKQKILDKTNGSCAYCGTDLSLESMTVDHIIPISKEGSNDLDNLFPACSTCNHLKDSMTLEEFNAMKKTLRESAIKNPKKIFVSIFSFLRRLFHNMIINLPQVHIQSVYM